MPSPVVCFVCIALPITFEAFIDSSSLAALATPLPALTSLSPLFILPVTLTGTLPATATVHHFVVQHSLSMLVSHLLLQILYLNSSSFTAVISSAPPSATTVPGCIHIIVYKVFC